MTRTWRIGEVAERTGLTRRTLRHYDELGLLIPSSRSWGDYRLYDADDLLRLLQIQNLKALGLSLDEIGKALADPSLDATATLRSHRSMLQERIASQQRLADQLDKLAETTDRSWEEVLAAIALTSLHTHSDPTARVRAALIGSGRGTEELFESLATEADPAVAEMLIWALAQRPGVSQRALSQAQTAPAFLRPGLIRLLGKAGDSDAVPFLIEQTAAGDPAVVAATVNALTLLADQRAAPALAGLLGSGRAVDATVIDALAAIGPAATPTLIDALETGPASARALAVEALGRIVDGGRADPQPVVAALSRVLRDEDVELRQAALLELAELGAAGRAAVATAIDDPEVGVLATRLLELH